MHEREPVAQALNYIISALDIVACMALQNETYDEVAAEEEALKFVSKRVDLILRLIKSRRPVAHKPGIRIVK